MKRLLMQHWKFLLLAGLIAWFGRDGLRGAIPTQTAWEVRASVGADTNGAGYVVGTTATTTDYSQNNNKNAAACSSCGSSTQDLSTTDAVANGTTTITSATANFVAAKGNIVYFTGGTGSITAVRRQVVSVTNTTTIVLDASIAASTGMTMNIGGAALTIGAVLTPATTGNIIWVKASGTYAITASLVLPNNQTPSNTAPRNRLLGYSATRGDCATPASCVGRPLIQGTTTSTVIWIDANNAGWDIQGLNLDCNNLTGSTGIRAGFFTNVYNNKIANCKTRAISSGGQSVMIVGNEVTGTGSTGDGSIVSIGTNGCVISQNWVHDNAAPGISFTSGCVIDHNLVTNNTGASSDGITCNLGGDTAQGSFVTGNTVYASGRDGIRFNCSGQAFATGSFVRNNIVVNNSVALACGINGGSAAGWGAFPWYDGNFYFNNTTNRCFMDDTGATNPINGSSPYTNTLDVIGTADPFVAAGSNNFALNTTAGGGAAARAVGTPGAIPGVSQVGYPDMGVFQSQAPAGGGNAAYAQ